MLVSVLLPTHIRRPWLQQAIDCYLSQDWPEKELVVVDEGDCRDLFDVVPKSELVYFTDKPKTHNLSMKLNIGCHIARGEVIVHFFSDDWSAPSRVTNQVNALIESGLDVGGYCAALFWDVIKKRATRYQGTPGYAWGSTFCYSRNYAIKNPWNESVNASEDGQFLAVAKKARAISDKSAIDGTGQMVCRLHGENYKSIGAHYPQELFPAEFLRLEGIN